LVGIDAASGGVTVRYDNETQDVLISPDYLVGAPPVVDDEDVGDTTPDSRKRSREEMSPFEAEWIGVFPAMDENGNEYYMRGKLQKDWNDPNQTKKFLRGS